MDYKDLLIETMEMDENTLHLAEKTANDFGVTPLGKGEIRECVCSLKEHHFDVSLSSEILRATYEKIVRKAVSELQAIDSEFDWDIDGVNSKITCYGKVVNKWQDIVDIVSIQKRLMEKLRSEILARYPYFTPKVIDAIIEDVPLEDIIYNFEIDRAAACGLEPGTLTVLEWNRPVIVHGEPGRSFEFVGEISPLLAISDLSTQHSDVRFGCRVAVTGEDDEKVLEADGDFIQGMWES